MKWLLYWICLSLALGFLGYLLPRRWNPFRWAIRLVSWRQVATVGGISYQVNTLTGERRALAPQGRKPNTDWLEGRVDNPTDYAWRTRTAPPPGRPAPEQPTLNGRAAKPPFISDPPC